MAGGSKGRKGGGGGGGGGGAASEKNALGQEIALGGEKAAVSNSRLFGVNTEAQDLKQYKNYSKETQAGYIEGVAIQLKGREDGGALTKRASKDVSTLWKNTSSEAKDSLAKQGFLASKNVKNPAVRKIAADVERRAAKIEAKTRSDRAAKRKTSSQDDSRDLFDGF